MAAVRIVERHVVKPAWPAPESSMFLSAVDIMCRAMPHNRRILFYKVVNPEEYAVVLERLKASLSVVLAHFYPLAGRLKGGDGPNMGGGPHADQMGGRLYLDCSDEGVELVEAHVEGISFEQLQLSDFEDTQPLFMQLAPWIDPPDYARAPPLSVQVSRFECGSIALGIAHSHVVCDGTSLWHFMTSWAECARGEKISLPPVHTRTLLKLENPSSKQAFLQVEGVDDEVANPSDQDELKLFHFSKDMVRTLKEKAGGERSSYEAMCAHIWKHASKARGHAWDKKVSFIHIVNMRKRMHPTLSEGYFGNALMWTNAIATAGELEEEDLSRTANRIHESVASCNDFAFKGWLHWLEVYDRDEIFASCMLNGARIRASSSPRFPTFEVDLGWGAPIAVRCPSIELPGKIIFFPSADGFGSIDMTLALPFSIMQRLASDHDFVNP